MYFNTMYKSMTIFLKRKIAEHTFKNGIISPECCQIFSNLKITWYYRKR